MDAKQYFIYLFRVKKTQEIIYVGSCKAIGNRLNEHRRAFRDSKHELPIHSYMKQHGLKLFDDVEVVITEYLSDATKDDALSKEAEYYYKYRDTLQNTRPAEIREGEFSPRNKPVRCMSDNKEFISIRQAADHYNLDRVTIMNHLNKGSILKNGLVFEYVRSADNVERSIYRIKCVEDDLYFSTYQACGKHYGLTPQQIYNRLRNTNTFRHSGKTFEKCNDYRTR